MAPENTTQLVTDWGIPPQLPPIIGDEYYISFSAVGVSGDVIPKVPPAPNVVQLVGQNPPELWTNRYGVYDSVPGEAIQ